jgi:EAL domain-containing protein (putative c-di-GMP-specific phosphodiesterase class I)/GGDEF domain-containing protein/CBS domain-containing protein
MTSFRGSLAVRRMLEETIAHSEVHSVYQPIVDLQSAQLIGYEALSRPSSGSPFKHVGEMFDAAEEVGLLWNLEQVTRRISMLSASKWPAGLQMFVNTTPQVFSDPRFARAVIESVREVEGLSPGRVVLEITERSDKQHIEGLEEQVRLVRSAGFQVAIDDVGAGTSGLQRIIALRPHWLKIDRELVEGIHRDRVKQHMMRFFLHFARTSGVRMIAEGIETYEELQTLIQLGVPVGQGFLLGKPGSREQQVDPELAEWIRRIRGGVGDGAESGNNVSKFARPTVMVDSSVPVREVASQLLRQSSTPGVAVMDGKRFAGWCEREQILRAASDDRAEHPVAFVMNPEVVTAGLDTTIRDAVELAASRDERSMMLPLLLAENGHLRGMLTVRDLLHAAADLAADGHLRTNALTALPNQVRAEMHVADLIRRRDQESAEGRESRPVDVAMIDVRNLSWYNEQFGYELGDELIRRAAGMIHGVVCRGDPSIYLAHLRSARFLVTARSGVLAPRIGQLLVQFNRAVASLVGTRVGAVQTRGDVTAGGASLPGTSDENRVRLHVGLVERAIERIAVPRDLYAMASSVIEFTEASGDWPNGDAPAGRIQNDPPIRKIA